MKNNDCKSFRDSLCGRLQNKNAVIHHLLYTPDNDIEVSGDLNVGHEEEVVSSDTITYASDEFIEIQNCLQFIQSCTTSDNQMPLSTDVCNEVELRTRGQSDNKLWFEARKGRITASLFHDVLKRKESTNPGKLVEKIIGENNEQLTTAAIKWGLKHENIAKKRYQAHMRLHGKEKISVKNCGLFLLQSFIAIGASPDGIVQTNTNTYLVEIKCPFKWRNSTILEACKSPDFYCYLDSNNKIQLKQNHRYYTQIQGQMGVCQYKVCHLVLYTLQDLTVIEIPFNAVFWESLLSKLKTFYMKFVIPCLNATVEK